MPKRTKSRSSKPRFRSELTPAEVRRLLGDEGSALLLRALGLTTTRGGASADSHRKLKQITHFLRLVEPSIRDVLDRHDEPVVVDAAAGKGYLGLVASQLLFRPAGKGRLFAIEQRPDLVDRIENIASQHQLPVTVEPSSIVDATLPERVHYLLALHACDTATDEAIVRGVAARADYIAVVPCCQAEVAQQLKVLGEGSAASALWKHRMHRREMGAHLTNVIRALALESRGYQVTVTELAGWEHSLKNELILARRVGRYHAEANARLEALLEQVPVTPWLLRTLPPVELPESVE